MCQGERGGTGGAEGIIVMGTLHRGDKSRREYLSQMMTVGVLVMISLLLEEKREMFTAGKKCVEPDVRAAEDRSLYEQYIITGSASFPTNSRCQETIRLVSRRAFGIRTGGGFEVCRERRDVFVVR